MPKAKGKKRRVSSENSSSQQDLPQDSGVSSVGLGLGPGFDVNETYFGIGKPPENYTESSPEDQIETGISEIIKSCYEQLYSINQAKKQRMEQQVRSALQVSDTKLPFCPNLLDKRQVKLKELLPLKSTGGLDNDCFFKSQSDCEKGISTVQKLLKNHQRIGFEKVLLNEVTAFQKRAESFVKTIDKQEIEQQEQTTKMQQELKDEMGLLQKNVVKHTETSGAGTSYKSKLVY